MWRRISNKGRLIQFVIISWTPEDYGNATEVAQLVLLVVDEVFFLLNVPRYIAGHLLLAQFQILLLKLVQRAELGEQINARKLDVGGF